MLDWIANLWKRFRKQRVPGTTPPGPGFTAAPPGVVGAQRREVWSVNGVLLDELESSLTALRLPDGSIIEIRRHGYLMTADGALIHKLHDVGCCALCRDLAVQEVEQGRLDPHFLSRVGLCRLSMLRWSALSGQPLCPLHSRVVIDPRTGMPMVVSVLEEDELAFQQLIHQPGQVLRRILLGGQS